MGKPISGIVCLILQITLIGRLPAAISAFFAINNDYGERRFADFRRETGRN